MTPRQLRTLVFSGWGNPHRGVMVSPDAPDPFRASVRAALLISPRAVTCRVTGARVHQLWGLPVWNVREQPRLIFPVGVTHNPRAGLHRHSGLLPGEATVQDGLAVTTLVRTLHDLALVLALDELVCAIDSALRLGWVPGTVGPERGRRRLAEALALADARSESPLETKARLLLVRAGLVPEDLQLIMKDARGRVWARWDMAWPSARVAVELDGREFHEGLHRGDSPRDAGCALIRGCCRSQSWYRRQPGISAPNQAQVGQVRNANGRVPVPVSDAGQFAAGRWFGRWSWSTPKKSWWSRLMKSHWPSRRA